MDLPWQYNFHTSTLRIFNVLRTEKWVDCYFLVGTPPNQKIIAAHKLILAAASPIFERMFYGQLPDIEDPIVVPDVQPDVFQAMLAYIYADCINTESLEKAFELCYVAKKYMLLRLVELCTFYLGKHLKPSNACRAYEYAKLIDQPTLLSWSLEIIDRNTKEVLASPSFMDISASTLMDILDRDNLNIESELDLFNALVRFSTEREMFCDKSLDESSEFIVVDGDDSEEEAEIVAPSMPSNEQPSISAAANNPYNLMDAQRLIIDETVLREAVKKIRFLTMTPQQFGEGPARSKLLEQHDALNIFIKICCPSLPLAMPKGFSCSYSNRYWRPYELLFPRHFPPFNIMPAAVNGGMYAPTEYSLSSRTTATSLSSVTIDGAPTPEFDYHDNRIQNFDQPNQEPQIPALVPYDGQMEPGAI